MSVPNLEKQKALTHERLLELVSYDPETGMFHRRVGTTRGIKAGDIMGTDKGDGLFAYVECKRYLLHRLAWFYMTGAWPNIIDHINRNPYDNRWCNLRNTTQAMNRKNNSRYSHNTSGVTGVRRKRWSSGSMSRWCAEIWVDGQTRTIGYFDNFDEAVSARRSEELRLWGEFAPRGCA